MVGRMIVKRLWVQVVRCDDPEQIRSAIQFFRGHKSQAETRCLGGDMTITPQNRNTTEHSKQEKEQRLLDRSQMRIQARSRLQEVCSV